MLPSPGSMKLSRVTNWRARRWKFGVMFSPNWVSEPSPFEPLCRSPRIWSKVVLLDDVNDVLDVLAQKPHDSMSPSSLAP